MKQVVTASTRPPVSFGPALGPGTGRRTGWRHVMASALGRRMALPRPCWQRARRFCRACGYGWLPGVEEGDDGQDALVGVQGGVDFELAEDAVDVLFHRTLRYPQGLGDPGVGLTLGHQLQHLSFS